MNQHWFGSLEEASSRDASFEIARALVVLAEIERRSGNEAAATKHAAAASERFDRLGVVATAFGARRAS